MNTTVFGRGTINIVPDGLTDWVWRDELTGQKRKEGIRVRSIQFNPSKETDRLIIRDGRLEGAIQAFNSGPMEKPYPVIKYFYHTRLTRMVIRASDCVFETPANCMIIIEYF